MGYALCRFRDETGCYEKGSQEYNVLLPDLGIRINVPSMWKHYMTEHLVQPNENEREIVMAADPSKATGILAGTLSISKEIPEEVLIMYVEKTESGYTHQTGIKPDVEFINKLEAILSKVPPWRTKGK